MRDAETERRVRVVLMMGAIVGVCVCDYASSRDESSRVVFADLCVQVEVCSSGGWGEE